MCEMHRRIELSGPLLNHSATTRCSGYLFCVDESSVQLAIVSGDADTASLFANSMLKVVV
jgi:hypothetical protein